MLYNRRGVIACRFILSACFLLLISGAVLAAMPVPDGEEFFQYQSITTPFQSDDPAQAKPIGSGAIADGGDTISLLVSSEFAGAVDLYLGIYIPEIDGLITGIPFPPDFADITMSGHVFGDEPEKECQELQRVTKPGGMIVLCPGNNDLENTTHQILVSQGFEWSRFEEPGAGIKRKYWKVKIQSHREW